MPADHKKPRCDECHGSITGSIRTNTPVSISCPDPACRHPSTWHVTCIQQACRNGPCSVQCKACKKQMSFVPRLWTDTLRTLIAPVWMEWPEWSRTIPSMWWPLLWPILTMAVMHFGFFTAVLFYSAAPYTAISDNHDGSWFVTFETAFKVVGDMGKTATWVMYLAKRSHTTCSMLAVGMWIWGWFWLSLLLAGGRLCWWFWSRFVRRRNVNRDQVGLPFKIHTD